ncbi:class I SAM-dependent methyltransferase [Paenibacillus sp. FSL W8-0187]|uniref:class I SAM-dependent methyltransferase n=1 Tax=Paenibacillus sp. FSL W8-0187 TaxID=2921710 RepID=UPI0030D84018
MKKVKSGLASLDWNHEHASRYVETIARKIPGYSLIYDMAERLITARLGEDYGEAHFLVVGAGGGQEIVGFGSEHEEWNFQGVDPSSSMLEITRQRVEQRRMADRVALLQGTVNVLPREVVYDAATCLLVLHFVEELALKRELLRQIAARLKPSAPFVLSHIGGDVDSAAFRIQMMAWRKHMLDNGIPEEEWDRFSQSMGNGSYPVTDYVMRELLEETGFKDVTRYYGAFLIEGWFAVKG